MKHVAVVGTGISGLATARALAPHARVTLFESAGHCGGHSHTVDMTLDGVTHGVDCGFLVFNHRTYPNLVRLFAALGVETAPSEMSFSVQVPSARVEWSGNDLAGVFAQVRNLARPRFLGMLADIVRFNRVATALAVHGAEAELAQSVGDFLDAHRFGGAFRDWYFLPMIGCIWSCPTDQMMRFPVATLIRFCHNHGLIQITGRPQWHTVRGGSRNYVERMLKGLADVRLRTPVRGVRRLRAESPRDSGAGSDGFDPNDGVLVRTDAGSERFDEVVLACHSDQSLSLLDDAAADERAVLGAIRYHPNRALLHTDARVLPRRRSAWAAWNYARAADAGREQSAVCLHYLINRLQPLPWSQPVIVSLNPDPSSMPDPASVVADHAYSHPVFDLPAIAAQQRLPALQGRGHVWFCGAWTRYGFHEDGLTSALSVVERVLQTWGTGLSADAFAASRAQATIVSDTAPQTVHAASASAAA